jgi:hypothetical protein
VDVLAPEARATATQGSLRELILRLLPSRQTFADAICSGESTNTTPREFANLRALGTGKPLYPAIEFEDGSWYREESREMARTVSEGRLIGKQQRGIAATP